MVQPYVDSSPPVLTPFHAWWLAIRLLRPWLGHRVHTDTLDMRLGKFHWWRTPKVHDAMFAPTPPGLMVIRLLGEHRRVMQYPCTPAGITGAAGMLMDSVARPEDRDKFHENLQDLFKRLTGALAAESLLSLDDVKIPTDHTDMWLAALELVWRLDPVVEVLLAARGQQGRDLLQKLGGTEVEAEFQAAARCRQLEDFCEDLSLADPKHLKTREELRAWDREVGLSECKPCTSSRKPQRVVVRPDPGKPAPSAPPERPPARIGLLVAGFLLGASAAWLGFLLLLKGC